MMRSSTTVLLALAVFFTCVLADRPLFDRSDLYEALGTYGNMVNALAKYSPARCGGSVSNATALALAAREHVFTNFASNVRAFQTSGPPPINWTVPGTFTIFGLTPPVALRTSDDLRNQLVNFYIFLFTNAFTSSTGWIYSTPTVKFTTRDPEFGNQPTALVTVENISDGFSCGPSGETKNVFRDTFYHKFCLDVDGDGDHATWKICKFYELNKFVYEQPDSAYTHTAPAGSQP
jgi:hypothetical protein